MPTGNTQILADIMNNDPKPYPDINLALHDISNLHSQCGRRFEVSMLCIDNPVPLNCSKILVK